MSSLTITELFGCKINVVSFPIRQMYLSLRVMNEPVAKLPTTGNYSLLAFDVYTSIGIFLVLVMFAMQDSHVTCSIARKFLYSYEVFGW